MKWHSLSLCHFIILTFCEFHKFHKSQITALYVQSRTLAKRVAEVIEDISDTFKRKSDEIKRKFAPEEPPPVIKPVSMAEKLAKLKRQKEAMEKKGKDGKDKKPPSKD